MQGTASLGKTKQAPSLGPPPSPMPHKVRSCAGSELCMFCKRRKNKALTTGSPPTAHISIPCRLMMLLIKGLNFFLHSDSGVKPTGESLGNPFIGPGRKSALGQCFLFLVS